jgi:hypothetical protein
VSRSSASISDRPEPPVDLHVAELALHLVVAPEPPGHPGKGETEDGDAGADQLRRLAEVQQVERPGGERPARQHQADQHERDRQPGERPPGHRRLEVERHFDLAGQRGLELRIRVERPEPPTVERSRGAS